MSRHPGRLLVIERVAAGVRVEGGGGPDRVASELERQLRSRERRGGTRLIVDIDAAGGRQIRGIVGVQRLFITLRLQQQAVLAGLERLVETADLREKQRVPDDDVVLEIGVEIVAAETLPDPARAFEAEERRLGVGLDMAVMRGPAFELPQEMLAAGGEDIDVEVDAMRIRHLNNLAPVCVLDLDQRGVTWPEQAVDLKDDPVENRAPNRARVRPVRSVDRIRLVTAEKMRNQEGDAHGFLPGRADDLIPLFAGTTASFSRYFARQAAGDTGSGAGAWPRFQSSCRACFPTTSRRRSRVSTKPRRRWTMKSSSSRRSR